MRKFLIALAALTASILYYGFVFMRLWDWFVVPTFGVPPLSFAAACGLDLTVSLLIVTSSVEPKDNESFQQIILSSITRSITRPTFFLVVGFIFSQFVS